MYDDLLLLQPLPPKLVEFWGAVVAAGGDQPVHTMTDRELTQERGSGVKLPSWKSTPTVKVWGLEAPMNGCLAQKVRKMDEMSSDDWSLLLVLEVAASTK